MTITPAEDEQALRISKAIEQYLSKGHAVNVRSEELYQMLAADGLVERDHEKGKHFRAFLLRLVKANMLNLIPQCKAFPRAGGKYEWNFNRAADRMPVRKQGAAPKPTTEALTPE